MRWCASLLPVVVAGLVGCGGGSLPTHAGGGAGGVGTGQGGAGNTPMDFVWGNTTVRVEPTSPALSGLTVQVTDQAASQNVSGTLEFPPGTDQFSADGAIVVAHITCVAPGLYAIDIYSCGEGNGLGLTGTEPGCLGVWFNRDGTVIGRFVASNGVSCDIRSGSAMMRVPPPASTVHTDGGPPPDAASGTFTLDCQGSDGALRHDLHFEGTFALPVWSSILAC